MKEEYSIKFEQGKRSSLKRVDTIQARSDLDFDVYFILSSFTLFSITFNSIVVSNSKF